MKFFTLNESNQIDGVTSPEELLSWMENNITYELVDDEYSNSNGIPTKTAQEVLKTKTGHCAEQSYLEKMILDDLGYKSFYGMVKENNSEKEYGAEGSAHLFLIYLDEDNKYCWFEHSMQHCKGIHKFNSLEELFKEVSKQWWRYDKNSDILECRIIDRDITGVNNWGLAKECYKYPVKYTFPISDNAMEDDIPLDAKWDFDHRSVLQESFDSRLNKIDAYIQNAFGQDSPGNGCIFIAPNGKFINIYPKLIDHEDLAEWLNENGYDSVPVEAEWFVDTLGYTRCRNSRNQCYIELPIVAITRHQLYALEEWLVNKVVTNQIEIEAPNGQWHTYDLKEYFPEDIIKIIKRFYSSGNLYEDLSSSDTTNGNLIDICNKIHNEVIKHGGDDNQNCKLCTWAVELQMRGEDFLPRPVYSPRDPIFTISGENIVVNPQVQKISSASDVEKQVLSSDNGSRFYCHVNWKDSNGGHEFLLINDNGTVLIVDSQSNYIGKISDDSEYFEDINFENSYISRLDDKPINQEVSKYNDFDYVVEWDDSIDRNLLEDASPNSTSMYFLSEHNMDGEVLTPRIPDNFLTRGGYEDTTTSRVCFASTVGKALTALSKNLTNTELYVHIPVSVNPEEVYRPTEKEVPDAKVTGEIWYTEAVEIKCIGKIKVLSDDGKNGLPYKYGNNTAELYGWNWEWLEQYPLKEALSTKVTRRDNPNDFSPFGYKVDFYDGDTHIGEGSVCGIKDDNAFLYDFEVYPEFRGKGYSKEMLQYLIDQYDLKQLFVKPDNTVAINLYKKYGFKFEDDAYDTDDIGNMRLMIRESYPMKFKLTEGKNLEQTVQQYVDKYQKMIPLDDDELYIHRNHVMGLISIDPTYKPGGNVTGDYAIWILNQAIKNGWDVIGTKQRVLHLLTEFQDKKSLLKNKDIMSYKTPDDLAQALSEVELTDRQKERRARNNTAMTKKVLSTDNWDVYMALNWEGALTLGKGTKWCTADSENASWYIRYVADIWWDGDAGAVEVKDLAKETLTLQDVAGAMQDDDITLEQIYDKYSDRAVFAYWDGSGWLYNPYEVKDDGDAHDKLYVFINKHTGIKYQFCMSSSQAEYEEDLNDAITFCTQNDHYRDFRDFIGYEEKELREFWTDVMGYSMQELFSIDPDEEDDIEESFLTEAKADTQRLIDWAGEELANRYLAIKDRLKAPENDLYYWIKNKSTQDLEATVSEVESSKSNTKLKSEVGDGAKLIGENSHWKLYHITTFEASQKYGRDTRWCITGINGYGDKYWNEYTDDGIKFYFFISKVDYDDRGTDSKFALALHSDYTWELYNQRDDQVYELPDTERLYVEGISVKKLIRGDIIRCAECGYIIDKNESYFSPNNEYICEICFNTDYDFCNGCGEIINKDALNQIDDYQYCDDCTAYCSNCGAGAYYLDIKDGKCPSCRDEEGIDESYNSNRMRFTLTEDIAAVQKNFPNIDDETFRQLIALDPTFNPNRDSVGTYGKWILTLYSKGEIKDEDWENVTQMLDVWETNKKRFTNKDIGQFKTLKQLEDTLLDMPDLELSHRQKVRQNQKNRRKADLGNEADLVFDGTDWEVWVPKTYAASCKLGQHTSWCTASTEDEHYFHQYSSQGKLYIVINKHDDKKKYQFQVETNSYVNSDDEVICLIDFLFDEGEELFDFFVKLLLDDWGFTPGIGMDDTEEVSISKGQIEEVLSNVTVGWNTVTGDDCYSMIFDSQDWVEGFYFDTFYEEMLGVAIEALNEENKNRIKELTGLEEITTSSVTDYDNFLFEAFVEAIKRAYNESASYNVEAEAVMALEDAASAVEGIRADFHSDELVVKGTVSSFIELFREYQDYSDDMRYIFDDYLSMAIGSCIVANYDFQKPRGDEWGEIEDDLFNDYLENSLDDWFGRKEDQ